MIQGSTYQFDAPSAITSDGAHVWVANCVICDGGSVTELSATSGRLIRVIQESRYQIYAPDAIASDGSHVWVANCVGCVTGQVGADSVTELAARSGRLIRVIHGARYRFNGPDSIASDGAHVWVANGGESVTELSAISGRLIRMVRGPKYQFNAPSAVALVGPDVWVANVSSNSVTEFPAGCRCR